MWGGDERLGRLRLAILSVVGVLALWIPSSGQAALRWSAPVLIDHAPPTQSTVFSASSGPGLITCASTRLCIAFGDGGVTSTTRPGHPGTWSWPVPLSLGGGISAASCPSVSLCIAVSTAGDVAVSSRPASGIWRLTQRGTPALRFAGALSCPSAAFCVAVDFAGDVITSRDPTRGGATWSVAHLVPGINDPGGGGLTGVSCPSTRLCVAIDGDGNVLTSTNPTGGPSAWRSGQVVPNVLVHGVPNGLRTVSCPSPSRCVATNGHGDIASSSRPSAGASSWRVVHVARASGSGELSCVASLCVVGAEKGILWSRNPTAANPRWHLTDLSLELTAAGVGPLACPSVSVCLGGDAYNLLSSVKPTGPASAWRLRPLPIVHSLLGVSCPTAKLCVAVDDQGDVVTSTAPAAKTPIWRASNIPLADRLSPISCGSPSLCVAGDSGGGQSIFVSKRPTAGGKAWKPVEGVDFSSVSCPSASLCVGGNQGGLIVSTNPAGGRAAWRSYDVDDATYSCPAFPGDNSTCRAAVIAVSCPTTSFCLAVDNVGNTLTSTSPAAGPSSWTPHGQIGLIPPPPEREQPPTLALSCPSARLCVAVNSLGQIEASTNPTGGPGDWTRTQLAVPVGDSAAVCGPNDACLVGLTGVSCQATSCVAVAATGEAFTSTNPTGGASAWRRASINRGIPLSAVSCANRSLCVAVDPYGYAVIGRG